MNPTTANHGLTALSWVIIWGTASVILLIIVYNVYIMQMSSKSIFQNSGKPISMAQTVLSSIQSTSQFLFGIFIVSMLSVLIVEATIKTDIGVPIITSVIGFLLGRTPKSPNT